MQTFSVISLEANQNLGAKVAEVYPDSFMRINDNTWLVADSGRTTKDVCDRLGATNGEFGSVVVFLIESYFGWASKTIWEWLHVKGEAK